MQRSGRAQALEFLHRLFADDNLRRPLGHCPMGLADLVAWGGRLGLVFTPTDLQAVYKQEFALRWAIADMTRAASAKTD